MRLIVKVCCLFCLVVCAARADAQAELRAIDARWNALRLASDVDGLARLLRDDFVLTHSDGRVEDKRSYVGDLGRGSRVNHAIDNFDVEVRQHGDVAIVTGRTLQRGVGNGVPFEGQFRFTRVWLRSDGVWQLAASHSSRLPTAPASPGAGGQ